MATTDGSPTRGTGFGILNRVGPGLVTACVVIGPGSILTSSQVGAREGFSKIWVIAVAVIFMMTFTTMAARLGAVSQRSTADLVAERAGRWLAVLVGGAVFFISAAFQFGNNLGVHAALTTWIPFDYWVIVLNALAITFVFAFRNLYLVLERVMACFVGVMLVSFALNLSFAKPDVPEMVAGLNPLSGLSELELPLLGLIGTTFVISAAYYQSYLVRQKGWTADDLKSGLIDARVAAGIMFLITVMIMSTAASVLRGRELKSVSDVAEQLVPFFGPEGQVIFCVGLFSAAFSSFIVNSMIGGFILADALNCGSRTTDTWPRILTTVVLLTGMLVALYVIRTGTRPLPAIVAAQAATVIAAPLMAFVLLWLTNRRDVMGDHCNGPLLNGFGITGLVLLLAMAWYTAANKVWPALQPLLRDA